MATKDPPLTRAQELALVRKVQAGDTRAYDQLVTPLLPEVYRVLRGYQANAPHLNVGDLVGEILLNCWTRIDSFDEEKTFGQFIFGRVYNHVRWALAERPREIPIGQLAQDDDVQPDWFMDRAQEALALINDIGAYGGAPLPEADTEPSDQFRAYLALALDYGGYPHQVLSFAHSIILWGRPKDERRAERRMERQGGRQEERVGVIGVPARVVAELSHVQLASQTELLQGDLVGLKALAPEAVDETFRAHDYRLGLKGKQLFAKDRTSAKAFAAVGEVETGHTLLKQYYGIDSKRAADPKATLEADETHQGRRVVTDWTNRVKKRVTRILSGEYELARSTLPQPESRGNGSGED